MVHWEATSAGWDHCGIKEGFWCHSDSRQTRPIVNSLMQRFMLSNVTEERGILHAGFISPVFDRDEYEYVDLLDGEYNTNIGPRSFTELKKLHRGCASWRKMLFMQPACKKLRFRCDEEGDFFCVENPAGITLQDIVDGLREHWFVCPPKFYNFEIKRWDYEGWLDQEIDCNMRVRDPSGWSLLSELENK